MLSLRKCLAIKTDQFSKFIRFGSPTRPLWYSKYYQNQYLNINDDLNKNKKKSLKPALNIFPAALRTTTRHFGSLLSLILIKDFIKRWLDTLLNILVACFSLAISQKIKRLKTKPKKATGLLNSSGIFEYVLVIIPSLSGYFFWSCLPLFVVVRRISELKL